MGRGRGRERGARLGRALAVISLAVVAAAAGARGARVAWREVPSEQSGRAASPEATLVALDWSVVIELAAETGPHPQGRRRLGAAEAVFELPRVGATRCVLDTSAVFPRALLLKFPSLLALSGACEGGSQLSLLADTTRRGSLTGSVLMAGGDRLFVDRSSWSTGPHPQGRRLAAAEAELDRYVVYTARTLRAPQVKPICAGTGPRPQGRLLGAGAGAGAGGALAHEEHEHASPDAPAARERRRLRRELDASRPRSAFKVRLALTATYAYSAYFGNTVEGVLLQFGSLLQRLNGIFAREVGLIFVLPETADQLVCVNTSARAACDALTLTPGSSSGESTETNLRNAAFLRAAGLAESAFDLGLVLFRSPPGAAANGVARMFGLCNNSTGARSEAATGSPEPTNDPFWVDFVAHEVAHMLGAKHTFQDCSGFDSKDPFNHFVEPGSGSTIMSYAGICKNNLQSHADAYFHAVSLLDMRAELGAKVGSNGCGAQLEAGVAERAAVVAPQPVCSVPVGNAFALRAVPTTTQPGSFAWEWSDMGQRSLFNDATAPRFRSWPPRGVATRYFPNLAYLLETRRSGRLFLDERLPSAATSMNFTVTMRTQYAAGAAAQAQAGGPDLATLGDFATAGVRVSFVAGVAPLRLTSIAGMLLPRVAETGPHPQGRRRLDNETTPTQPVLVAPNRPLALSWDGASAALTAQIEVLVALNTLPALAADQALDPEAGLAEPRWAMLGTFPNVGAATVVLPARDEVNALPLLVMLRGGADGCSFFDVREVTLLPGDTRAKTDPEPQPQPQPQPQPAPGPAASTTLIAGGAGGAVLLLGVALLVARRRRAGGLSTDVTAVHRGSPVVRFKSELAVHRGKTESKLVASSNPMFHTSESPQQDS